MNVITRQTRLFAGRLGWLSLALLLCCSPAVTQQPPQSSPSDSTEAQAAARQQTPQVTGKISGTVADPSGVNITGAIVKLTRDTELTGQEVATDEDGKFYFFNVSPGPFQLTFSSPGLTPQEVSGSLNAGESYVTPLVTLAIATQVTQVQVTLTPDEIATAEIKEQEKQRVLGFIPNFYVSYTPNAAPLKTKHKFELAWKTTTDPVTLAAVG